MFDPYRISERSSSVPSPSFWSVQLLDEVAEHLHVVAIELCVTADLGSGPRRGESHRGS